MALAALASSGPRVRVAALMLMDDKVVLVRHRAGRSTYHLLPGGGVGYRETLEAALRREIREETGLEAHIGRLLFVNDTIDPNGSRHVVNLTFEAVVAGGALSDHPEDPRVEAVDLVPASKIAALDLRPPLAASIAGHLGGDTQAPGYLGSLFREAP